MDSSALCSSCPEGLEVSTSGRRRRKRSSSSALSRRQSTPTDEGGGANVHHVTPSQSADSGFMEGVELTTPESSFQKLTTPESSFQKLTTPESLSVKLTTPEASLEQLTTPESSFQNSTTPESSFQNSTTPELLSVKLTTPEASLEQLTTPEASLEQLTTPEASLEQLTTPGTFTVELTTPESSFQKLTTPESSFQNSTTPESSTVELTTPESSTVELTTPESSFQNSTTPESSFEQLTTPESSSVELTTPGTFHVELTTPESSTVDLTTPGSSAVDVTTLGASAVGVTTLGDAILRRLSLTTDSGQAAKALSRSASRRSHRSVQFAVPEAEAEVTSPGEEEEEEEETTTTVAPPATPTPTPEARAPPSLAAGGRQRETEEERGARVGGFWPHAPSSLFATITCTVGMFDICRFSYLSFQYGGGFILQFLMLTVVFGLPMLSFQMTVGQYLGAGIMDMWKVSPIFYGVGVSSVVSMALYGIYNVIPVSWMFVYFRDSFVTNLTFKWGECRNVYRPEECQKYPSFNSSDILERAIPAYFQNRVLQRQSFGNNTANSNDLVFENVFNLAVIWMVIFICLSKGIKSYGKVVLAFGIFPMLSFYLLSIELLRRASSGAELIMSLHTDMNSFFLNGWSWLAAAREVFFIWGMNGAAIMQIASHNKHRHNLKRDCAIVIVITLSIVLLSAFLACACIYIIYKYDRFQHRFVPSSFETMSSARFLLPNQQFELLNINMEDFVSTNYLVGVQSVAFNGDTTRTSGHQVARFATELYPTALVTLTPSRVSAFWPVLFYLCLITFGVAQQLAIWKCVVEGVIAIYPEKLRSWETSITFLSCVFGFVLGLPFVTQVGVHVVHFMDVCIGSAWWIMLIYLVQIFALLLVRGRPYTSDDIVVVLTNTPVMKRWLAPVISFSWNVVLPIAFLVLSITSFKMGDFGQLFFWDDGSGYVFWPLWAKQVGAFIQILPIVVIPSVSLVQIMRYVGKNTGGFMERFENLVRPAPSLLPSIPEGAASAQATPSTEAEVTSSTPDDPPPKYTPPPSYNTATGMKLLKRLNSLRLSFRRSQRSRVSADVEMQRTAAGAGGDPQTATTAADVPPSYSGSSDAGSEASPAT